MMRCFECGSEYSKEEQEECVLCGNVMCENCMDYNKSGEPVCGYCMAESDIYE